MSYMIKYLKKWFKEKTHYISIMSNTSQELSSKSKVDYQNGKIYIVRNSVNDLTYIGSTCQSLSPQHRVDTKKNKKNHMKLHKLMNELHVENFYIELMEYYPCNTREELFFRKRGNVLDNINLC